MISELIKKRIKEMEKSQKDEDFIDPKLGNLKVFLKKPDDSQIITTINNEGKIIYIGK